MFISKDWEWEIPKSDCWDLLRLWPTKVAIFVVQDCRDFMYHRKIMPFCLAEHTENGTLSTYMSVFIVIRLCSKLRFRRLRLGARAWLPLLLTLRSKLIADGKNTFFKSLLWRSKSVLGIIHKWRHAKRGKGAGLLVAQVHKV